MMVNETYMMSEDDFFSNTFVCFEFKKNNDDSIIRAFFKLNNLHQPVFWRDYTFEAGNLKETQFLYSDQNQLLINHQLENEQYGEGQYQLFKFFLSKEKYEILSDDFISIHNIQ